MRAQGLWNSREEGKWVAVEVARMHKEQGIRSVQRPPSRMMMFSFSSKSYAQGTLLDHFFYHLVVGPLPVLVCRF